MALSDIFAVPTMVISRWKLTENGDLDDAVDSGSEGNTLNRIGSTWVVEGVAASPPYESSAFARSRFIANVGSATNSRFEALNLGRTYAPDEVSNFSVMGWVYPSGAHTDEGMKVIGIMWDSDTIDNSMRWMIENTIAIGQPAGNYKGAFGYRDDTSKFGNTPSVNPLTSGEWNHLALVYNQAGGEILFYQNGYPTASGAVTGVMGSGLFGARMDFALGGMANDALNDFNGGLQDWVFVGRALGSGEIFEAAIGSEVESSSQTIATVGEFVSNASQSRFIKVS